MIQSSAEPLDPLHLQLMEDVLRRTKDGDQEDLEVPGLAFNQRTSPTDPASCLQTLSVAVSLQGSKQVALEEHQYLYQQGQFLITAVDLPTLSRVTEASEEKPFVSLTLKLDLQRMVDLLAEGQIPQDTQGPPLRAMAVGQVTRPMLQVLQRMMDLLDTPQDVPFLFPMMERELLYRLLTSAQGPHLRQMALTGSQGHAIGRAVSWMKDHFRESFHTSDLAEELGVSVSTFHRHFREVTGMTPVQFQKKLRLNEARRLMVTEHLDAASAAFRVGYESPSHFSREYRRQFGLPPASSIQQLRAGVSEASD